MFCFVGVSTCLSVISVNIDASVTGSDGNWTNTLFSYSVSSGSLYTFGVGRKWLPGLELMESSLIAFQP